MRSPLRKDRRRFVRAPLNRPARARQIPQSFLNGVHQLTALDLSEGGVQLSSPESFPLESLVLVDLDTPTPLRAVGRVAWTSRQTSNKNQWRVGVEFTELSRDARSRLRRFLGHGKVD
jgi:c-di-GMP-binding flagellar brake protein YcgR